MSLPAGKGDAVTASSTAAGVAGVVYGASAATRIRWH
jgi:hypothetical protein